MNFARLQAENCQNKYILETAEKVVILFWGLNIYLLKIQGIGNHLFHLEQKMKWIIDSLQSPICHVRDKCFKNLVENIN